MYVSNLERDVCATVAPDIIMNTYYDVLIMCEMPQIVPTKCHTES